MRLFNLLGTSSSSVEYSHLSGIFDGTNIPEDYEWLKPIINFLNQYLIPITITLVVMGAFLAIFMGIALARAEDSGKAADLKKRMWGLIVAILVILALIWLLAWLFSALPTIIETFRGPIQDNLPGGIEGPSSGGASSSSSSNSGGFAGGGSGGGGGTAW